MRENLMEFMRVCMHVLVLFLIPMPVSKNQCQKQRPLFTLQEGYLFDSILVP